MENKHLGRVLQLIAAAQQERDEERPNTKRLTLRDNDKLRIAMGKTAAELPTPRKRTHKPPTNPPMPLSAAAPNPDLSNYLVLPLLSPSRGQSKSNRA